MGRKRTDLTGQTFSRWTVLGWAEPNKTGMSKFRCQCQCGTMRDVLGRDLRRKEKPSKSCGCLQRDVISAYHRKRCHIDFNNYHDSNDILDDLPEYGGSYEDY